VCLGLLCFFDVLCVFLELRRFFVAFFTFIVVFRPPEESTFVYPIFLSESNVAALVFRLSSFMYVKFK
jgi:hypothetical protein